MKQRLVLMTAIWTATALCGAALGAADRLNVLFIAIDDLNHWVGHLGRHPQTKTPHIDRLAGSGVTFTRAYCTAPACNPSRASLMSGQRPSTTGCYLNSQNWRPGIDEQKLLNSHLARAGYGVFGAGKIYHGAADRGGHWDNYFAGKGNARRHADAKDDGVGGIQFYPLANSDEELYDEAADPLEYKNLATNTEYAARKSELAKWLPKVDAANLPIAEAGGVKTKTGNPQ